MRPTVPENRPHGVGAGNVPAFVERTAQVPKAVADIISGKLFDYGVLCSTESALICDAPVKRTVVDECVGGGHFVSGNDKARSCLASCLTIGAQ